MWSYLKCGVFRDKKNPARVCYLKCHIFIVLWVRIFHNFFLPYPKQTSSYVDYSYLTCLAAVIHNKTHPGQVRTRIPKNWPRILYITIVFAVTSALNSVHRFWLSFTIVITPGDKVRDNDHLVIATKITRCQSISFRHLQIINWRLKEKVKDNHL